MFAVLKQNVTPEQLDTLSAWLRGCGVEPHIFRGLNQTVVGLIGDTANVDMELLRAMDAIESVTRISEPTRRVMRSTHPIDTVVQVGSLSIGGGSFQLIAGPCSVESREQIHCIADAVKRSGAGLLRGGAFKPRTSPYDFQGLRAEGIELLLEAKQQTGMPIVTEIMSAKHLELFEHVDVIQVGARNMQNFELLKELGRCGKPILLKRGLSSTLDELLMSAEYLMAGGNENIILCERGIRTFETHTRNTLDLSIVPMLHELTHLPVIVDPSHGTGLSRLVPPMALAAVACGADGIMIEVHNDPLHALCDGAQALPLDEFNLLAKKIRTLREVL